MFKVNNKNNRTKCEICSKLTPMASFSCLYCYLWTYFTLYSSVSIGNFEHVITAWVLELCKENTIEQDPENFVANIYVFKFTIRNTTKSCDICSKLTIKAVLLTSLWCLYCWFWTYFISFSSVSIVDFEQMLAGLGRKHCWTSTNKNYATLSYTTFLPKSKRQKLGFCSMGFFLILKSGKFLWLP